MKNEEGKIWFGLGLDNEELKRDAEQSKNIFRSIGDKTVAEGARIDNAYKKIAGTVAAAFSVVAIKQFGMELIDITGKFQTFEAVLTNTLQSPLKAHSKPVKLCRCYKTLRQQPHFRWMHLPGRS